MCHSNSNKEKGSLIKSIKVKLRAGRDKIGSIGVSIIIIAIGIIIGDIAVLSIDFTSVTPYAIRWIILSAISVPIALFGLIKIYYSQKKGNYSSLYLFGHMLSLLTLSILYTVSIEIIGRYTGYTASISSIIGSFNNIEVLRFLIVMFVLLNAVILPLFLPLIKVIWMKRPYNKDLKHRIKYVEEISHRMADEMPKLCEAIMMQQAMKST